MTRLGLASELARRRGLTRTAATAIVDQVIEGISCALEEGQRVEIRGFGTMRCRQYPSYVGRNPSTGSDVVVSAKVLPVFRPGRQLVRLVNDANTE